MDRLVGRMRQEAAGAFVGSFPSRSAALAAWLRDLADAAEAGDALGDLELVARVFADRYAAVDVAGATHVLDRDLLADARERRRDPA